MGHVMHRKTSADSPHNCIVPRVDPARLALYLDKDPTQIQGVLQLTRNAQKRERLPNCSLTVEAAETPGGSLPVYFMIEQQPQAPSRLTLGDETDALGVPRLHLDWRFRESDFADLRRAAAVFATELSRHEIGELRYGIAERSLIHYLQMARHHIGTTRMHPLRELGVVNENCRAHGIENLYVAGTSVFPTSGISNPTLAILALAIRLADHLQETTSAS
jgi:choline dehydrogenase-like flavoprotein